VVDRDPEEELAVLIALGRKFQKKSIPWDEHCHVVAVGSRSDKFQDEHGLKRRWTNNSLQHRHGLMVEMTRGPACGQGRDLKPDAVSHSSFS
jgi:hypothetical protein